MNHLHPKCPYVFPRGINKGMECNAPITSGTLFCKNCTEENDFHNYAGNNICCPNCIDEKFSKFVDAGYMRDELCENCIRD